MTEDFDSGYFERGVLRTSREMTTSTYRNLLFAELAEHNPALLVGAGRRALEIGCGYGYVTEMLAEQGYEVVGTDISAHAIESRRASPRTSGRASRSGTPRRRRPSRGASTSSSRSRSSSTSTNRRRRCAGGRSISPRARGLAHLHDAEPARSRERYWRDPTHVSVRSDGAWRRAFLVAADWDSLSVDAVQWVPGLWRLQQQIRFFPAEGGRPAANPRDVTVGVRLSASDGVPTRLGRREVACLVVLVVALESAILGPLLGRGWLQLFDLSSYPVAPHATRVPLSSYGFPPGITSRAPLYAAFGWLFHELRWAPMQLLPVAAVAPLACVAFARLLAGRAVEIGAATLLFTVNPLVFERLANGQWYVVMGYAARRRSSRCASGRCGRSLRPGRSAGWSSPWRWPRPCTTSSSSGRAARRGGRPARRPRPPARRGGVRRDRGLGALHFRPVLARAGGAVGDGRTRVGTVDLGCSAPGDPVVGLGVNVAGLFGFWRPGTSRRTGCRAGRCCSSRSLSSLPTGLLGSRIAGPAVARSRRRAVRSWSQAGCSHRDHKARPGPCTRGCSRTCPGSR